MKFIVLLLLLAVFATPAIATPDASQVVVRGRQDLSDLLVSATRDAWKDPGKMRPVSIVIDVTPYTQLAAARIRAGLERIGEQIMSLDGSWRIGALGQPLGGEVKHPTGLLPQVGRALTFETSERNTIRALKKSIGHFAKDGVIVYLADWRIEDDHGLESFLQGMKAKRQSFRVIGTEGCFGRPWSDAFFPRVQADARQRYEVGLGRNPFGQNHSDAPWHSGDTAGPHLPWHFGEGHWRMTFSHVWSRLGTDELPFIEEDEYGKPEILESRIREVTEETRGLAYPLSSSFGPWPLMRLAAETGGHYYLFSFNPYGRTDLEYDYARCNLFSPDLRSRREILASIRRDPIASTLYRAWDRLGNEKLKFAAITPPLARNGVPVTMEYAEGRKRLSFGWCSKEGYQLFLRNARHYIEALDDAGGMLDHALSAPLRKAGSSRRWRADAELFRHIISVFRFELGEAVAAAQEIKPGDWDDDDTCPGIAHETFIPRGDDPGRAERFKHIGAYQVKRGKELVAARKSHLERFGGTPFGEIVARNSVRTFRPKRYIKVKDFNEGPPDASTPSESAGKKSPTPKAGPGSTSGGGATSGR